MFRGLRPGRQVRLQVFVWASRLHDEVGAPAFAERELGGRSAEASPHAPSVPRKKGIESFKWLTLPAFCLGVLESFFYGVYAGLVFVPIYNLLARRWGTETTHQVR